MIIGKRYKAEFKPPSSESYKNELINKEIERVKKDFNNLTISTLDTLVRTFDEDSRKRYIKAAQLFKRKINPYSIILEAATYDISAMKRRSLIIYLGFFIAIEIVVILLLATGMHFTNRKSST